MVDLSIARLLEYGLMSRPRSGLMFALCVGSLALAGCSGKAPVRAAAPQPTPQPAPPPVQATAPAPAVPSTPAPQRPPADPVADLITLSSRHFDKAQSEFQAGHLEAARSEFDRALDVLLKSPYGARTEPRLRAHFDRLVERISAVEATALAQGQAFTEKKAEPASIDQLRTLSTFETPEPTPATTETVADDLSETTHDIDIPLNKRVLSYVELFSGRLKGYLQDGLNRGTPYLPMIQEIFRAEGIPLDLAYVPLIESAFKTNAVSRAKATGMWQFMRGTALENGLKQDWYIDERADPEKATRAAAKYLKTLYGMFGDWHLALASYNGGPGRVQRAMKRSGKKDFWQLSASRQFLPQETRDYVPLILAAVVVARNPGQYGITLPEPAPSFIAERVILPSAVDLRRVAEWLDVPVQAIQELNPELRRWTTPLRMSEYELKVPEGAGEIVRARLAETDPLELAPLNRHTVKKGETLISIARKLGVSRADLAEANYLSASSKLKAGQALIIPRAPTLLALTPRTPPPPVVPSEPVDAVTALADVVATADTGRTLPISTSSVHAAAARAPVAASSTRSEPIRIVHRVRAGETLTSIARAYGTTVAALKQTNRLRGSMIQAGQRLSVMTTRTSSTD
jgi:membrane-bound lytic murein transglycosylase D